MLSQADDLLTEIHSIADLLAPLADPLFETVTAFKDWTINDVLRHLHVWNHAAFLSYAQPEDFQAFMARVQNSGKAGQSMRDVEREASDGLGGQALVRRWVAYAGEMCSAMRTADPAKRVKWAGPDMSVRSSVSARLMETWAHGQEIYDVLGVERHSGEHIRNIVVLGYNTYGWTFRNRRLAVPEPTPGLRLVSPLGETWTYGDVAGEELVSGSAEAFCQVVTQVRNIADTTLEVRGPNAQAWMAIAQCFAGPPSDPPETGSRRMAATRLVPV
ncbi:MAG: TIGR03084 family protein [Pseudomonadales bacterium]|nr:TIGR03084 family protein [Pseudomonadales bacterium]